MVSFQILTTTADMMMTAKMASVAMPISMISGAVGASRASVTWLPFSIRQYPKICLRMLRWEMMHVRPTKKCAKLMARAGVATSAVGRLRRVTTAKQMATSRPVRMMVQAGLMEEVSVLSAGEPIFL